MPSFYPDRLGTNIRKDTQKEARSCRDGRVSAAELQRTFVGVVDGLSNAEAAELVRELVPSGGGGSSGGRGGRASRGQPDLNRLHELLTQNPAATAGSEERLLKRVRDQLLSLPGGAEHAIATAFKSFDTDGDGSLSRQEFRSENGHFEPFIYKNEHFTKTGSGQT
jgi:hypothetical protein